MGTPDYDLLPVPAVHQSLMLLKVRKKLSISFFLESIYKKD